MMKTYTSLLAATLFCFCQTTVHANDWFLDLGFGGGEIDVDIENPMGIVEELADDDAGFMGSIGAGYSFSDSFYAKLTFSDFGSLAPLLLFTERVEYSSIRAGFGFEYPAEGRFAVNLEAGATYWDAKVRESGVGNPGPEDTATTDGIDLYGRVGLVFRFTDRFEVGAHRDYERNDLGTAGSAQLVFRFRF